MSKNIVKLVAIASVAAFGIEVQNMEGVVQKTFLVEAITEQPTPEAIRAKLNAAVEKLGEDYVVVAPSKHKLVGTQTAQQAGLPRDALHGYESFQVRENWSPEFKKRASATLTLDAALKATTATTGSIATRKGAPTKASLVRDIIRTGLKANHSTEQMIASIVSATSFAVQLARVYFKENLKKVYGKQEAPAAEPAAATETTTDTGVETAVA